MSETKYTNDKNIWHKGDPSNDWEGLYQDANEWEEPERMKELIQNTKRDLHK